MEVTTAAYHAYNMLTTITTINTTPTFVSWLVLYGTFSTNRLYHATEVGNVSYRAGGEHKYHAIKQRKNSIN